MSTVAEHTGPDPRGATVLAGPWRAAEADDELRRAAADPDLDDRDWEPVTVPGHWRDVPAFSASDGPIIYRVPFEAAAPTAGRRAWLDFEGIFYQGDVWLDGAYLTDTEGYFVPHSVEVTEALTARRDHVLAVEVTCSRPSDLTLKRNLTGIFQHWDCLDPDWNPGGLWRPVSVRETGPVHLERLRAVVLEADADRAIVQIDAALDAVSTHTVEVATFVDPAGPDHVGAAAHLTEEHVLAAGHNKLTWRVAIEDPDLWWPRALGDQPMYDLRVEVHLAGRLTDVTTRRIGLRHVELRHYVCTVNSERLFLKGVDIGPARPALGSATPEEVRAPVDRAVEAGLDLLRLVGHIGHPDLYDHADRAGVLLWQDLPLQWGYARGIRGQAVRQAEAAVDLLGHHPSVAVWCGHNEPFPLDVRPGHRPDARPTGRFRMGGLAAHQLPSWNRTVLGRSLKRALERADASRPVIAQSGVLPHPPQLDGSDSHLWFGWYHGEARDLRTLAARLPRMVRFVSEFGAHSVPVGLPLPDRWPPDERARAVLTSWGLPVDVAERHVPFHDYATPEAWADATRRYQAELVRHHVTLLRRLKYRPTGGFAVYLLQDAQHGIFPGLIDVDGTAKPAWEALVRACAAVIVAVDRMPSPMLPGAHVELDVHVVNDRRTPVEEADVYATIGWQDELLEWHFAGDVAADSVARVGRIGFEAPTEGLVDLQLRLVGPDGLETTHQHSARVEA